MPEFDIKAASPDTSLPSTGFLFGADSQASANPSIYPLANAITSILENAASADILSFNSDTIFGRRNAANFRLGAADAAAPVAQTLSVQSVVAGTTNTAGANLTITGSQGTGTGAGGSLIFQVAPAGSSGSAQNALATALTIASTRAATFANALTLGVNSNSALSLIFTTANVGNEGFSATANEIGLWSNGSGSFAWKAGSYMVGSSVEIGWSSTASPIAQSFDLILARDAANTLAQRSGANAQESRIYGSYTSGTNFQRMSIKTLRESSGALSGATYTSTIAIPAYAVLIGVTTRVNTAITGATSYSVGDGTTANLWGNNIAIAINSQSRTADFTAVGAVGAAAASRTVRLTANGSNFTGGVVEICLHYLTTEAD
jgi:hypothetical protein